jgi:hypothetical protein
MKDVLWWGWRVLGSVVLVAAACLATYGAVVIWQGDEDLQHNGARADVPVVSIDDSDPKSIEARVHMPDGSIASVDARSRLHVGDRVQVVYWVDDQADAEAPGWPTTDAIANVVMAGFVGLLAVFGTYKLVVKPIRYRPTIRPVSNGATPRRRTSAREARDRRKRRSARRSRSVNRRS